MLAARSESTVRTEPSGNGAPANTPDDRVTGVVVGSLVNVGLAGLLAGLTYTALPALIGGAGGERSRLALLVSDITINVIAELVALPAVYTLILSRMGGTGTYRGAFLGNLAGFVAGLALLPLVAISAGPSSRRESSWIVYGIAAPVIVFTGMSIGYEISSSPQPTTATTATTRERASPRAQIFPGIQLNNSIQGLTLSGTF